MILFMSGACWSSSGRRPGLSAATSSSSAAWSCGLLRTAQTRYVRVTAVVSEPATMKLVASWRTWVRSTGYFLPPPPYKDFPRSLTVESVRSVFS